MTTEEQASELRKTGISVIGDVRWGTHFCCFYETKQDLLDALVLYFKAGLENNEFCLWVVAHPLAAKEAKRALGQAIPDLDRHLAEGGLEIHGHDEWYLDNGRWDSQRVLQSWRDKLNHTSAKGYAGLRASGDAGWIKNGDWMAFREYEKQVDALIAEQRSIILCTYPLTTSPGDQVFDVAHIHQVAVARRHGSWETVETPQLKKAKAEIIRLNDELEQKVEERTRELVAANETLRSEIAERKLAEDAVKKADDRIRLTIDAIPTMAWSLRPDGVLDFLNQRWLDYTGLSLEEAIEEPTRAVHPEDLSRAVEKWLMAKATSEAYEDEMRLRRADGEYRWFLVRIAPLRDARGNLITWYGVATDIEDRKQAEMQSQALIDAIPHQIWSSPPDGAIDYCNHRWRSYTGLELEDVRGYGWQTMVHPEDRDRVLKAWRHSVANGTPYEQEERHRGTDGTYRRFLSLGVPLRDPQGRIVRWYGTNTDIEDRKRAEEALRRSEKLFAVFMDHLPGFAWMKDLEGRYVYLNKKEAELDVYRDGAIGKTDSELWPAEIASAYRANDQQVITTRKALQAVEPSLANGERSYMLVSKFPIFDQEGSVVMVAGAGVDITDLTQAKNALNAQALRYKTLMETSTDSICVLDGKGDLQEANAAFLSRLGYTSAEANGLNVVDFDAQWDREQLEDKRRQPFDKSAVFETRHRRKDGSVFDVEVSATSVQIGDEQLFFCVTRDITERKRVEQSQRESQLRYETLVQSIDGIVWEADPKTFMFTFVSKQAEKILGYPLEQWFEGPGFWPDHMHPGDRDWAVKFCVDATARGEDHQFEYRMISADGRVVWLNDIVSLDVAADQSATLRGLMVDITERKLADQALRESETKFRRLLGSNIVGVVFWTIQGDILDANDLFLKMIDYTREDLRQGNLDWTSLTPPEYAGVDEKAVGELLTTGTCRPFEKEYIRKDGSRLSVLIGSALLDDQKQTGSSFVMDITERKQAEDALRRSEEKFKTLFGIAPVGISVLDRQHNVIDANPALERITRLRREELLNEKHPHRTILKADGTPMLPAEFPSERAMTENRPVHDAEAGVVLENGEIIWVQVSVAPLALPEASAVVITQDMTERKRAVKELQEANDQLQILSRRLFQVQEDEKRHMARELHDEIGQALTAAKINLQSAQRVDDPADLARRLDESIGILDGLLQQTRRLSLDLRPPLLDDLGLVPTLRSYVDEQAQRAGFRVTFFADPRLERLSAEIETACFRVAQQALTNATRHAQARNVNVELHLAPQALHLIVRDDGAGFDVKAAEERGRRGESFGLPGMRERLSLVGGELDLKSILGRGTEVHAFLPLGIDSHVSGLV